VAPAPPPVAPGAIGGQDDLRGILLMVAAMAGFALEDSLVKIAARSLPPGEVLLLLGLWGALLFALLARRDGTALFGADVLSPTMQVRAVFEVVARLFYFLAVALTPLSTATAIMQATPVLVVIGASLWLGERVGWRRWCAVAVGLIGVLVVLRPTAEDFSPLSWLAVAGMVGFAGRDLASRAAPPSLGIRRLGFFGFLAIAVAGLLYTMWDRFVLGGDALVVPDAPAATAIAAATLVGALAYAALMRALRTGEISVVAPFRYTRIIFGVGAGVLLFGEPLDAVMLSGCAIILAAGSLVAFDARSPRPEAD
jgi:drug/metabolite transporter (DMT)-like permease